VHDPVHMRPTIWTNPEHIIHKLENSQYQDVRDWAKLIPNISDSDQFDEFCTRLHQHDQHRGLNFATVFPEMAPYLK